MAKKTAKKKKIAKRKLTPAELRAARSRGGKSGKGHKWNPTAASVAGKKGAAARAAKKAGTHKLTVSELADQTSIDDSRADQVDADSFTNDSE